MVSAPPTVALFTPERGRAGQGFAGPAGTALDRIVPVSPASRTVENDGSQGLGFVRIIDRAVIKKAAARDPRTGWLKRDSASLVA